MLTLNDGRKELYQWDTGRTATVDIECDVVHFANLQYGESLAVEVKENKVNVPNKLLTSGAPIYCWAFVIDESGAYTKKEQILDVIKRAKPSDYVYTETEVITIQTAVENALNEYALNFIPNPSTASIGQTIVVKAVDENGVPTEWEAADFPSGGGDIPKTLPNPYALIFTGAVMGSYDGSEAVSVEIPNTVTDDHINSLIDTKLGVIENGSY